jgi:hypothetical protein
MKKIFIVIGIVFALGLAASGGFYGGMRYQTAQAGQSRSDFFNARGQLPADGSSFPGAAADGSTNGAPPAGQFPGGLGGGTTGIVKTIDGDVLTISTAQDVTTVNLTETTTVQETVTGTLADLQPGVRVRILGQTDDQGAISASQIVILDDSQAGQPAFDGNGYPGPASGAEPTPAN